MTHMAPDVAAGGLAIGDPNLGPATNGVVDAAVRRAQERHLLDWLLEGRRRASEATVRGRFGRLLNEVDAALDLQADATLWVGEYRIETTAARPDRPVVRHRAERQPLPPGRFEDVETAGGASLAPDADPDVRRAVNRTLAVFRRAVERYATSQLAEFVERYEEVVGGVAGSGPGTSPRAGRTALRTFDLGDATAAVRVPTEASRF